MRTEPASHVELNPTKGTRPRWAYEPVSTPETNAWSLVFDHMRRQNRTRQHPRAERVRRSRVVRVARSVSGYVPGMVGICADVPGQRIGGEWAYCRLLHGHTGAHSDGDGHWLTRAPRTLMTMGDQR